MARLEGRLSFNPVRVPHMTEPIHRRSRMRRTSGGRRIVPGARDIEIFRLLYQFGPLHSIDLAALIKPRSVKRFIERLGHLYHDGGYLDRPVQQWEHGQALCQPVVHSLSQKGRVALEESSYELPHRAVPGRPRQPGHRVPQFRHALGISTTLASVAASCAAQRQQRFVPHGEIILRSGCDGSAIPVTIPVSAHNPGAPLETNIIPDGLYGIEYALEDGTKGYRFFAVEVELSSPLRRGTLKQSSTLKKLLAYQAALHSGSYKTALGVPNLFVHLVARDADHQTAIIALMEELLTPEERKMFKLSMLE